MSLSHSLILCVCLLTTGPGSVFQQGIIWLHLFCAPYPVLKSLISVSMNVSGSFLSQFKYVRLEGIASGTEINKSLWQVASALLPRAVSYRGHRRCTPALPLRCASTEWWWWCGSWCRTGPPVWRQTAPFQIDKENQQKVMPLHFITLKRESKVKKLWKVKRSHTSRL